MLGNFGSVRGLKLDVVANLVGMPGKYDVHGDMVLELYYQGKYEVIDEYCQSDVLNTYGVYLHYELLKGNLSVAEYKGILEIWRENLPKDKAYHRIFFDTITKQIES